VSNWAEVDPSLEYARLDGPFATGAKGTTKPRGQSATDWVIGAVEPFKRAVIYVPVAGATLTCTWTFADAKPDGSSITQHMELSGEAANEYAPRIGPEMEKQVPLGMKRVAEAIERMS
jgi:hypothetical protein